MSSGYGFTAIIVAFLGRLNPVGILVAGLFLALTFIGGESAQISMKVPLDLTKVFQGILLFYVLACNSFIVYRDPPAAVACEKPCRPMLETLHNILQLIFSVSFILTVITASTPLLLASAGELVVERSGVLNLGIEGMMIMGAACGFAGAYLTGSTLVGALCGICAGAAMSAVFGFLTLGLAVNQVAAGLALTIFGIGLSGLIGAGFVGQQIVPAAQLHLPILTDLPVVGRILFGDDAFVYVSIALVICHLAVSLPDARRLGAAGSRR